MSKKDKDRDGVNYEGAVSPEEAVKYLQNICEGLLAREVNVANGFDHIILVPGDTLRLKVRARAEKQEQSLKFELAWEAAAAPVVPGRLEITGPVPEVSSPAGDGSHDSRRARPGGAARRKQRESGG